MFKRAFLQFFPHADEMKCLSSTCYSESTGTEPASSVLRDDLQHGNGSANMFNNNMKYMVRTFPVKFPAQN
jgi:hypothetical protein